ncbi:MAG TPA: 50S ribosomal protein L23 [Nevskiaceae bacterium]|nr:50S ribosomal protein L23 [Nevskiaceae bacterium]
MAGERLHSILLAPVVSEKSTRLADKYHQAVFKVRLDAEKSEIRRAVETLLKVKVEGVRTVTVKGKARRFGRFVGRRSDWKKAYISLAAGQEIDLSAGVGA